VLCAGGMPWAVVCQKLVATHPGAALEREDSMRSCVSWCSLKSFLLVLAGSTFLFSQSRPPLSDSQAIALASQSIAALTRGSAISDVRLTANVTWARGAEPAVGTGVLLAKGFSDSRIDLAFGEGKRTEIRNGFDGPAGKWVNPDGQSGKYAFHNCLTDAAWFFPALSSLAKAGDPRFVFSYVGEETWNGQAAQHIRIYQVQKDFKDVQRLSTMDFYLDPTSSLPLGVAFKSHPDKTGSIEMPVEIRFSEYEIVNGVEVPFHIQRLQSGALLMDLRVTMASFNNGLSDDVFESQ